MKKISINQSKITDDINLFLIKNNGLAGDSEIVCTGIQQYIHTDQLRIEYWKEQHKNVYEVCLQHTDDDYPDSENIDIEYSIEKDDQFDKFLINYGNELGITIKIPNHYIGNW